MPKWPERGTQKTLGPAGIWTQRSRSRASYANSPTTNCQKLLEKMKKFKKKIEIFEVNFKAIFDNQYANQKIQQKNNFWKWIVIQFTAN